jgi:transposase-like protein
LEATEKIGAGPLRAQGHPNRSSQRQPLAAAVDQGRDIELAIPKLRHGSFFPRS